MPVSSESDYHELVEAITKASAGDYHRTIKLLAQKVTRESLRMVLDALRCQHELDVSTLFRAPNRTVVQGLCRKCGSVGTSDMDIPQLSGHFNWKD